MNRGSDGRRASEAWASPHDRATARLSERITEPLEAAEALWLETHLAACAACRATEAAFREQHDLLRAMRTMPPPRDLWARTAAALDVEQARKAGHKVRSAPRRTAADRGRTMAPRVFSFPRGGWAPVGAIGSIAAVMVVGFLVGTMILGGTAGPGSTPGIAALPTATPKALPTPISVAQADVSWVSTSIDGSIIVRQAPVGDVCPSDAPAGCATIDTHASDVATLSVKPKSVHQSPTSGQMIVIGQQPGQTSLSMFVVNIDEAAPSPTPTASPRSTASTSPQTSASPTPTTDSASPVTDSPTPTTPATSPSPGETASTAPTASPPLTPSPSSNPTPNPSPTASIIPNVTPPPSAATMIALASDLAVLDAQTAAYSADGAWFAFTARALDLSSGSDIYLWHAGAAAATAVTTDHRSVFAGWAGDRLVGSRADEPDAAGGASPAAESASSQPSVSPDASAATVAAEFRATSFLVDPASLERAAIPGAVWRPAIDPTNRYVVFWDGTVILDPGSGAWRTGTGRLVLTAWPLVVSPAPSAESPSAAPSASGAPSSSTPSTQPSTTPKASRSASPAAPSSAPPSTSPSSEPPSSSPTIRVTVTPATALPDDVGTASGVDWAAAWDETGTHLAIWIGDHGDRSFGHLDLFVVDGSGAGPAIAGEPLRAQPALPGISLADGHLVWATPPGVNGIGSQLQVYAYSGVNAGVTSGQGQTGSDTVIVVQH